MTDDLFSWADSQSDRARVFGRLAPIILQFALEHSAFHADDLRDYCIQRTPGIAPDSPGRILRELRLRGQLDYVVVNRRQSLYQFRSLKED